MVYDRLKTYTTLQVNTMICCKNRDIFGIDIPTRAISVHENDQHVQV